MSRRGSTFLQNIANLKQGRKIEMKNRRSKPRYSVSNLVDNPLLNNFQTIEEQLQKYSQYEFKIVELNTESNHRFYKLLVGDEINTKGFAVLKTRVVLYLALEVIISNWHILCYLGMMTYCFINGGISGFVFIILLISFVIIEEAYPSLIFWRLAFFNACLSLILKLMVLELFLNKTSLTQTNSSGTYDTVEQDFIFYQWSYIILGSADGRIDSVVIILIIIQLILLDEMGIKQQKVNQFEDTSSAFVRMTLNRVFEIRYLESFKIRQLYLSALHNAS